MSKYTVLEAIGAMLSEAGRLEADLKHRGYGAETQPYKNHKDYIRGLSALINMVNGHTITTSSVWFRQVLDNIRRIKKLETKEQRKQAILALQDVYCNFMIDDVLPYSVETLIL